GTHTPGFCAIISPHKHRVPNDHEEFDVNKRTLTYASALLVLTTALLIALPVSVSGQTADATPTFSGPTNEVTAFFVACDTQSIMNLNGTLLVNYDIFYQVFSGANAT